MDCFKQNKLFSKNDNFGISIKHTHYFKDESKEPNILKNIIDEVWIIFKNNRPRFIYIKYDSDSNLVYLFDLQNHIFDEDDNLIIKNSPKEIMNNPDYNIIKRQFNISQCFPKGYVSREITIPIDLFQKFKK